MGSARIQVLHSIDVLGLEEILLERVARRPAGGLLDPLLIIVPTRELLTHLKRRIAMRFDAVLGLHFATHRSFAIRAIEGALEVPPREVPRAALACLVQSLADGEAGADGEYLRAHAGAREALLATFNDLRDAGLTPGDLDAAHFSAADCPAFVGRLYARYREALDRLAREGWTDASGLARAAVPHAADFVRRKGIRECIHHGAYELIGAHLELLQAIASAAPALFLLPGGVDDPSFAYSARFAEALRTRGAVVEPAPRPCAARAAWTDRLSFLPGSTSPGVPPASAPALEIRHAQGPEAELRAASLRALALHDGEEKVPLDEIIVVARTLEPYAPYIDAVFSRVGLPFTTSAVEPIARDPAAGAFLALLRVLAGGFERRAVIDLLRRPGLRFPGARPAPGDVERWDRRTREARIAGGLDAWRELPDIAPHLGSFRKDGEPETEEEKRRAESEQRSAGRLLAVLEDLEKERAEWAALRTFEEHAKFLAGLSRRWIAAPAQQRDGDGPGAVDEIIGAVEAAGAARTAAGSARAVTVEEVEELARSAAQSGGRRARGSPGVRILDLMQARGLTCSATIWIGFHRELYPRQPRPDPFLPEAARARLRERTGKLIAEKLHGRDEERLLLSMTLGAARERVVLSYQRAGEGGGKEPRSSALREVALAFTGKADVALLLDGSEQNRFRPDHVPAHPGECARHSASAFKVLHPDDAVIAAAVGMRGGPSGARAMLSALRKNEACGEAAIACVEEIESFSAGCGRFDGHTGSGIPTERALSPSAVERLARCPLSFFLRDILHLKELEDEVEPHRLEEYVLGNAAHAALRKIYATLAEKDLLRDAARAKESARDALEDLFRELLAREAGPSARRLEGLFELIGRRWIEKLGAFLEKDIESLSALKAPRIETEEGMKERVDLGKGAFLEVAGFVDRLVRAEGAVILDDYKTGKSIRGKLKEKGMLTGSSLQLPLYREMVAARLGLDPLAIQARLLGAGPDSDQEEVSLDSTSGIRAGILETVAVAVELARKGSFPLHAGEPEHSHCRYCGYRRTCRRTHEATLARLGNDSALEDFFLVKDKRAGMPTIASVRAQRAREKREEGAEG